MKRGERGKMRRHKGRGREKREKRNEKKGREE
jgi:hypothetical protein